jgi:hypothetical protein
LGIGRWKLRERQSELHRAQDTARLRYDALIP